MTSAAARKLAETIAGFATDPYGHARFCYPWGEPGPLEAVQGPRRWQGEVLREIGDHLSNPATRFQPKRIAVASGHGPGKSGLVGMVCRWALDTCPDTRIVVTANTENQLAGKTGPELAKWHNLAITRDWFKSSVLAQWSAEKGRDRSWRLDLVPWSKQSPESFAGLHNQGRRIVLIFDEASGIDDRIWEVAEGAMTDEETEILWLAFGNPIKNTGRFRECFGKYRNLWSTRHIDSRTVEGTNKEYLDSLVETYGVDSDIVKVRVLGQFPSQSSMQFIASDLAQSAAERSVGDGMLLPSDPIILGLDHARFGDDSTVLAIRQGRDARSRPWQHWHGANSMEIAGATAEAIQRHCADAICIDAGGPNAGGIIDRLRQLMPEFPVFEVPFGGKARDAVFNGEVRTAVANRRAEMYANMRAWLEKGAIPNEQRLIDDLTAIEYSFDVQNRILLERKEHLKARGLPSSDWSDALALTFAEPIMAKALPDYLNPENFGRAPTGYDRFADLDRGYVRT